MSFQPPLLSLLSWVFFFLFLYFDAFSLHFCLFERGACDLAYLWAENSFREPVLSAHHVVLRDQLRSSRLSRTCLSAEPFLWASFFFLYCHLERSVGGQIHVQMDTRPWNYFCEGQKKKKKASTNILSFLREYFPQDELTCFWLQWAYLKRECFQWKWVRSDMIGTSFGTGQFLKIAF